ncbi:Do family serine endopeptidase [Luteimonas viscosa]|uniref:Probable periplasmic serine endoprotease DegP-like n=1 Tax=Luteimonas viscosa TaxID=1132694 RepID=A0A5D4XM09_9GAMM|nr:Do family serine endopeptidase [Luteimonas viscosa]TYT25599.1 Do family serine endopeptidase [Luteimonas viscosa]
MKTPVPAFVLILLASAATTAVVLPIATAQTAPDAGPAAAPLAAQPTAVPASPLVTGLPDFTRLVEQVGPAVVKIDTTMGGRRAAARGAQTPDEAFPGDEQIPEIFRRFFGPGFQMPGPGGQGPAPRGRAMGTGFLISDDGYVLTNHHVIDNADEVTVTMSDLREFTAKVVGSDERSDVALLKIDGEGLPVLRTANGSAVKPGQWAVAIGSPFGLEQSVTAGIVSAVGRSNPYANQQYVPFIQTDVAINQGNSGGPLLNTAGEVIGINSQIFSNSGGYMGVSFAIPIDVAMNVVGQLKETGRVQRGQLGVVFSRSAITTEQARGFGLPDTLGALVTEVVPDSAADKAGIEPGDVIRSADGIAIRQPSDLPPIVGNKVPGTKMKIGVLREGRERTFDVTLSELDEGAVADAGAARPGAPSGAPSAGANALGLVTQDLTDAQRRQLGLDANEGVGIARVEGMAAREAGLSPGDVVLRVGRKPVGSAAALARELRDVEPGQTVMLLVRSPGGGSRFVAITPDADE